MDSTSKLMNKTLRIWTADKLDTTAIVEILHRRTNVVSRSRRSISGQIIGHNRFESPPMFQGPPLLVTAHLHKPALATLAMPMEPNRTRQVIQDLARAFNKLASELTADLSYAAREIDSLRKEVQRLRASSAKSNRTNGSSKKSTSHGTKTSGATHKNSTSHKATSHGSQDSHESPKPSHEPGSFVFPQEPFSPNPPAEPSSTGNN